MTEAPGRTESMFAAALALASAAEQAAYLDQACAGDAALRGHVEALLRAHGRAGHLLDRPVPGGLNETRADVSREQPGTIILGRYKLLEAIGEGGMGTVWVAEQTQPVKRKVALKLIKAGMDSKSVLARFEAERQALAVMDHPNIAKVLDGGITESGRPFFVMEYVKGVPITEYCDATRLSVSERLNLFVQVCQAVQHAHQKGIIHRDLKPSNILVAPYDDKPVPKVIDFGLAKAMHQSLTERTLHTAHETVLGTPLYMSPEQAQLNNIDVDTRSDIYSLGVLLYELLTGTTPVEKKRFKEAAWDEIRRIIREEEPLRPSMRLSTTSTLPSLAASRQTEPARLTYLVRGELDWIVMKSLEKDRTRRYETANGFALDVQRYLAGEPVLAAPPSARYRLRKFVRRHKGQVVAAGMVLAALLAGVVGTAVGLVHARIALARAEQAEAETLAEYRESTDDAIEQLIGSKPELGPKEKTYLENTLKRWQAFAARQGSDARSQAISAEGHFRVAKLWAHLGSREESQKEYQAARDIRKKLVEEFPAVPEYQRELGSAHTNNGIMLADLGKRIEAQAEYQAALVLQMKLVEQFPTVPTYQQDLAFTHHRLGLLLSEDFRKLEEARGEYQAARAIRTKLVEQFPAVPSYHQDLARTINNLGLLLVALGKNQEAVAEYQAAREIHKKLAAQFPAKPTYQHPLASTHTNLGILLKNLGRPVEAQAEFRAALDIFKKLIEQFPAVPAYQRDLSITHASLGLVLAPLGQLKEARAESRAALDIMKKLVEQFPSVPGYQIDLGGNYCNYGMSIRDEGKPAESLKWFDLAIGTLQPILQKEPRDATAKEYLRESHLNRARTYDRLQKPALAAKDWGCVIELSPPLEQPKFRANRAFSHIQAGQVAEAVAEVAELTAPVASSTRLTKWNAAQWYGFTRVYALASSKSVDKKLEYADRAMALLQKAVEAGWMDAARMAKDTALDSLRGRDDFKRLLAQLTIKARKAPDGRQ